LKKLLKGKKFIAFLTSLFMTITLFTAFPVIGYAADNEKNFDIIDVTDFHGTLNDTSGNPVAGVLADRLNNVKKSNPNRTLILGGGDLYQGSATSNIMKGVPVQEVMSKIGMEVTTLGNHEFDWGLDTTLNTTMKGAAYSIVCSNLYDKKVAREYLIHIKS
jgi:2',3'-cyclic-nucleotide 2'-phosphodiesterase/3'-nucleotidase